MDIINEIIKYESISIIGNYKNVGKTTTLNYVLENIKNRNIIIGITSIGVDGEDTDIVTKTNKPRIHVTKGSIIATAKGVMIESDVTKEILETTNISTPIGKIIIFRALSDGYVVLCGPSITSQVKYIINRLNYLGSEISFVDGALSRKSLCSPSITDATIFCSGAIIDKNVNKAIEKIVHDVNILNIDYIKDEEFYRIYNNYISNSIDKFKVIIMNNDYSYKILNISTILSNSNEILEYIDNDSKYIIINSTITDNLLESLLKFNKHKNVTILASDATKLFVNKEVFYKYLKCGGTIKTINKINMIGISINPTSIEGYEFNENYFIDNIKSRTNIDTFNILKSK